MSLLSSVGAGARVRCLADEEADHNMLQDLHLAAELGKTLLERNKELENCIKLHQCTIDDQAQEIEYMKKQTVALREVNDSRLKIYENLEVGIQDLERANHRLALENTNHKKQIKSHTTTIESLEARLDEQQKKYEDVLDKYESLLREQQQLNQHQELQQTSKSSDVTDSAPRLGTQLNQRDSSIHNSAVSPRKLSPEEDARIQQLINDQDTTKLVQQLKDAHFQRAREQKKVEELKEQFEALLQDLNQKEEELIVWKSKAQDVKNLQDEISTLEEVRQGHLCGRCLRQTDARNQEHLPAMMDREEEDDEMSLAESFADSIREADNTLQGVVANISTQVTETHAKSSLFWKILNCFWNPSTIVYPLYAKVGYYSPYRVVPRIAKKVLKPVCYPLVVVKRRALPKVANTLFRPFRPFLYPIEIIRRHIIPRNFF